MNPLNKVRVLSNIFTAQHCGLNICHANMRSLKSKFGEFCEMFVHTNLHAILISESWLKPHMSSQLFNLSGFKLYRNDRINRIGGGVAIYVRNFLNSRVVKVSQNSPIEYICLEVSSGGCKCLLCVVYCPPNTFSSDNISELEEWLQNHSSKYNNIVLGGDWNVNLLNRSQMSDNFLYTFQHLNLHVVNDRPTFFNTTNPSLLDLFLISDRSLVLLNAQINPPCIMDHDIIYLIINFDVSQNFKPKSCFIRDYFSIDYPLLHSACENTDWSPLYEMNSADDQVLFFNNIITTLFDNFVPIKRKRTSRKHCPWFSKEVVTLISEREYLFRRHKLLKTDESRRAYITVRNKITATVRKLKSAYFSSLLDPQLPPRSLWTNLSRVGVWSKDNASCDLDPNLLNKFFLSSAPSSITRPSRFIFPYDGFSLKCVEHFEVVNALYSIKSHAVGADNISPRFLKLILSHVLSPLSHIFNTCLTSSYFPSLWKMAYVTPIPKKTNSNCPSDYRPISILSFLSKVLEKVMHNQIVEYLNCRNLISPWQSGFRRSHSCETALLRITSDLRTMVDNGQAAILCLLDFTKAFDSLDHEILLLKLSHLFKFSSSATTLLRSFLSDRKQCVKLEGSTSDIMSVTSGVPQGSLLGPLLFSLFVNDLPSCIYHCHIHMYADDVQLYLGGNINSLQNCVDKINSDLNRISTWSLANCLTLNPLKSQVMFLSYLEIPSSSFPPILLNNCELLRVSKVKSLGISLNSKMSCCDYINDILKKIYYSLHKLKLTGRYLSLDMRLKLIRSLLIPHFIYGCVVFPSLDQSCVRKLNVAFNDCARYAFQLDRKAHISSYTNAILGCSLFNYLEFRSLLLFHKILYGSAPRYLNSFLKPLNTRRHLMILIPRFNRAIGERSYFIHASRLWNSLPAGIQRTSSYSAFKKLLWSHICSK